MSAPHKLTLTERSEVRALLLSGDAEVVIAHDECWFCDVAGNVFEGESPSDLLEELARIARES